MPDVLLSAPVFRPPPIPAPFFSKPIGGLLLACLPEPGDLRLRLRIDAKARADGKDEGGGWFAFGLGEGKLFEPRGYPNRRCSTRAQV